MYHLFERPPGVPCFRTHLKPLSEVLAWKLGYIGDTNLTHGSCFCGSSKSVADESYISINVLELLGTVVSAWVLVSACDEHPSAMGDCVLLCGDNEAAVEWVRHCRGGKEPRYGALMRLLGVLE